MEYPTVIELFSGTGGLCLGFELASYKTVSAIDIDKYSCETFKQNRTKIINKGGLTLLSETDIRDKNKVNKNSLLNGFSGEIDILSGGPPCQGMSLAGKRIIDDPRNQLFLHYKRILKDIKPKVFLFENVKGINTGKNYKILFDIIQATLEQTDPGYFVKSFLLSADNFGVPQKRERVFIIGLNKKYFKDSNIFDKFFKVIIKNGYEVIKQLKSKGKVTVSDALNDLKNTSIKVDEYTVYSKHPGCEYQKILRRIDDNIYTQKVKNHISLKHDNTMKLRFLLLDQGSGLKELSKKLNNELIDKLLNDKTFNYKNLNQFLKKFQIDLSKVNKNRLLPSRIYSQRHRKLIPRSQSHTVTCHLEDEIVNPYEPRVLTPREAARLQSFPDWYEFSGPNIVFHSNKETSQTEQIGNSVPPLLAYVIAKTINDVLFNNQKRGRINLDNDWKKIY